MLIVDSQVHVWAADRPDRPWPPPAHGLKPAPHRALPISAESLLSDMRAAGVNRAILVPPSWEGERNDVVLDACKTYPERYRYAARLDLNAPNIPNARDFIATWRDNRGMVALQLTFQTPLFQQPLVNGEIDWLWAAAEAAQLPLTIYLPNALMPHIARAAQRHPALNVVINHFGLTGSARDNAAFADFANLIIMARYPNVAVKASCLPFYSTEAYPYRGLHNYMRQAFDAFGPKRFFWGTDLSRLPGTYAQAVTLFTEELPWLAGADLEWVMGRAVCEWMDWDGRVSGKKAT
jgi:L-fuconolactonase